MSQARKAPRYKLIGGFPHIRIRSGAYRRIHEIVGGVLDGAVQIKTKRRWKWMKGPRRKPKEKSSVSWTLAADTSEMEWAENSSCPHPYEVAGNEATPREGASIRPPGHQLVIWTRKYDVLKPNAAMPQN